MSTTKPFTFICGQDDYLVGRMGAERFAGLTADLTDEFAQETVNGFAANMGEVEAALNRFRESVQTVSMFGGKRVVWLKDVNFLADSVTGRAEGTLKLVEDLQELLTGVNPAETSILITASPVDRRRAFPKWFAVRLRPFSQIAPDDIHPPVGVHHGYSDVYEMAYAAGLCDKLTAYSRGKVVDNGDGVWYVSNINDVYVEEYEK